MFLSGNIKKKKKEFHTGRQPSRKQAAEIRDGQNRHTVAGSKLKWQQAVTIQVKSESENFRALKTQQKV